MLALKKTFFLESNYRSLIYNVKVTNNYKIVDLKFLAQVVQEL